MRRKDTTKGPPLRILSLDGGGVRGFSMLIILQELMHRTFVEIEGRAPKRNEIPKPCDHFDLIAGTGTGGLIAIMLGRLRLDLDTCKDVYVRMTRRVFETDKTLFGVPLRSTMFKASMLEEAIRQCVKEHTVFADEGNDALANATPMTPTSRNSVNSPVPQRTLSQGSQYSQMGKASNRGVSWATSRLGDPDALLYDTRENRTKVAVTAVMRGTPVIALLRSYDSRKETAPDVNCTIWQAGRATAATQMAFKPIQIGQSVYLDDGAGKYNPAPQILDEAVQNEWPGREVGVFISIGTGKRPSTMTKNQHEWWEDVLGGSMGDFAEARRRLAAKMEGCEESHKYMLREHLALRGVKPENYYRLNVEIGLGETKMNEWYRLAEISTNTRMYLQKNDVQAMSSGASSKIAKIHFAKIRHDRAEARRSAGTDGVGSIGEYQNPWERPLFTAPHAPHPGAVELAGDESFRPAQHYGPDDYYQRPSIADQKYTVEGDGYDPQSPQVVSARPSTEHHNSLRFSNYLDTASPRESRDSQHLQQQHGQDYSYQHQQPGSSPPPRESPPPVPPKTPVQGGGLPYPSSGGPPPPPRTFMNMGDLGRQLPYPDVEGPPPAVDVAGKPKLF